MTGHANAHVEDQVYGHGDELLRATSAIVVDETEVLRAGLVHTLRRLGCTVVASGDAGDELLGAAMRHAPDLAIVGSHGARRPSDVVRLLKSVAFNLKVVHLAGSTDRDEFVALLKAGADAVVPMAIRTNALADVLRRVVGGERVYDGVSLAAVRPSLEPTAESRHPLSTREREVLAHLATRMSVASIASELYISVATVKTHSARIYQKLDASTRHQAVERAVALGLLV